MQLPALLTADLHLTAHSSTEYRWKLFPWLAEQCREERVKTLIILGDLTDAKDHHSAELVNRVVRAVKGLTEHVPAVKILTGNHDWLLEGQEFFRFLSVLDRVDFITHPKEDPDVEGPPTYYLPYSKNPTQDWKDMDFSHYDYLMMHQTVKGARASNGQVMDGDNVPDKLAAAGKVYSGDIHVPQKIGPVEYVGSPMHIHFGDDFRPRCVLLERPTSRGEARAVDLHFPAPRRIALRGSLADVEAARIDRGDQVKVAVRLAQEDAHDWLRVRRRVSDVVADRGAELHGLKMEVVRGGRSLRAAFDAAERRSPAAAVQRYVEREELGGDALDAGLDILEDKA